MKRKETWVTAIYFKVETHRDWRTIDKLILVTGKKGYDLVDDYANVLCMIESHVGVGNVSNVLEYMTTSRKI